MEKEISYSSTKEEEKKTKEKKEISFSSLKETSFVSSKDTEKEISFSLSLTADFKETKETPADLNWFPPRPWTSQPAVTHSVQFSRKMEENWNSLDKIQPAVARSVQFSRKMEENRNSLDKIAEALSHMEGRLGEPKDKKVELDACRHDFR